MEVHLAKKKKLINNTNIPEHEIEKIARCLLPDILAFYNSEDGQKEFEVWKETQSTDPATYLQHKIIKTPAYQ